MNRDCYGHGSTQHNDGTGGGHRVGEPRDQET